MNSLHQGHPPPGCRKILWVPHAGLDIPGYRETQFGMARALHLLGWSTLFLAKEFAGGNCREPGLPAQISWVKRKGSRWQIEMEMARRLRGLLREWHPDFVLFEPPGFRTLLPIFPSRGKRSSKPKLVLDIRTPPVGDFGLKGLIHWGNWLAGVLYAARMADGVTVISEPLARFVRRFLPKDLPVGLWSSGVDEEKFNPRASKPVEIPLPPGKNVLLFYHGSIAWNRGMPELLSAFAGAQKDRENLCLVVLGGSDAEREELARRFRRHGGKKGLLVLPPVENSEVPGYLAAADAGVCPLPDSWKWAVSSPLKVLEYAAMEKPVLATDIEAHRVIFEGSGAAVLAEKGTPEALRAAILKMVSNLDEMKEKAKASRSKILARYSWTAQARNLEIFLDALGPTHFQRSFAATRKSIGPIFPAIAGEEKSSSQD